MCRNIAKNENKDYIRNFLEKSSNIKTEISKMQMNRWNDFKVRRVKIIHKWIQALRKKKFAEFWVADQ